MAREKHEPSDGEIVKARAIAERFGHYSVNEMDRKSQEILVRSYYDTRPKKIYFIKGIWANEVRDREKEEKR